MDLGLFPRGLVLGLSVAAAVGPMAMLCIRRTLVQGQGMGLVTGIGIATADGCYALIAALGLAVVSDAMIEQRLWLELIGGAFLCYLGVTIIRSRPARHAATAVGVRDLAGAYGSAVALTLTNPMTIVSFTAMFAGLGLANAESYSSGAMLVLGVFLGSSAWWLFLTTMVRAARKRLTDRVLHGVNVVAGCVIAVFGLLAVTSAIVGGVTANP